VEKPAFRAPLHGGTDTVAVAQVDVVPHADLVTVIDDRRPGEREKQAIHELDPSPVVAEQRGQAATDPEIDACNRVASIDAIHVVAFFIRYHLERQLVVVAQEERPLRCFRNRRCLREDVDDREAIFHADRHEEARHEREMEGHVTLVTVAEVGDGVLRPLVRLGQQHPVRVTLVDVAPQFLQELVGFR